MAKRLGIIDGTFVSGNVPVFDTAGNLIDGGSGGGLALFAEQSGTLPTWDSVLVQRTAYEIHPLSAETDVHVVVAPKGEGSVFFCPINSYYNYNAGYQCADLQINASYGVSGLWNTGFGTSCFTGDDTMGCVAGGFNSGVFSGANSQGAVAIGDACSASGDGAVAFGAGTSHAPYSFTMNQGATYGTIGKEANGSKWYGTTPYPDYGNTVAQYGSTHLTVVTTNATPAILTAGGAAPAAAQVDYNGSYGDWVIGGVSTVNVVPIGGVQAITVRIIAAHVTATPTGVVTGDVADFEIKATVYRGPLTTDSVTILGNQAVTIFNKTAGAASWNATLVVNQTRRSVEVQVTGEAAKNIRWSARLDTVEVG